MPLTYKIDKNAGIIFTIASGILTEEELLEHKNKLRSDPEFIAGMVELSDVRNIERLSVTPQGIMKFAAQDSKDKELFKKYKLAIVVSQDLAFGMARMYEMMTSDNISNIGIFRNMDEAKEWLSQKENKS